MNLAKLKGEGGMQVRERVRVLSVRLGGVLGLLVAAVFLVPAAAFAVEPSGAQAAKLCCSVFPPEPPSSEGMLGGQFVGSILGAGTSVDFAGASA